MYTHIYREGKVSNSPTWGRLCIGKLNMVNLEAKVMVIQEVVRDKGNNSRIRPKKNNWIGQSNNNVSAF